MFNAEIQQIIDSWRELAMEYRARPLWHDELADPMASAQRLEALADQLVAILDGRADPPMRLYQRKRPTLDISGWQCYT